MTERYFRLDDVIDHFHDGINIEKAARLLLPWVAYEFCGDEDDDDVRHIASLIALAMVRQRDRERTLTQHA